MIDLNYLTGLVIVPVLILCGIIGWVWKHLTTKNNAYIPSIVTIAGAVIACIMMHKISASVIIGGAISGMASTGLHQLFDTISSGFVASNGVRDDIEITEDVALEMLEKNPELVFYDYDDLEVEEVINEE